MLHAINEDGKRIEPSPHTKGFCPGCKTPMVAKCGPTNVWHWSHESLQECDTWHYEAKTPWHLRWQDRFHKEDTEVVITKGDEYHIADIVGNKDVVIEIQNSPISADEIFEREVFYHKMLWVLNGRRFARNLIVDGFEVDRNENCVDQFIIDITDKKTGGLLSMKLIVPVDDDGAIYNCLKSNKRLYRQDEDEENIWHVTDVELLNGYELPSELKSAYISYALHESIFSKVDDDENTYYPVSFCWRHIKRSWLNAQSPVFIDIGHTFLIYITRIGNKYCDGRLITKQRFLKKYRKRLPTST